MSQSSSSWRAVCQIALFETDKSELAPKIAAARTAIITEIKRGIPKSSRTYSDMKRALERLSLMEGRSERNLRFF